MGPHSGRELSHPVQPRVLQRLGTRRRHQEFGQNNVLGTNLPNRVHLNFVAQYQAIVELDESSELDRFLHLRDLHAYRVVHGVRDNHVLHAVIG